MRCEMYLPLLFLFLLVIYYLLAFFYSSLRFHHSWLTYFINFSSLLLFFFFFKNQNFCTCCHGMICFFFIFKCQVHWVGSRTLRQKIVFYSSAKYLTIYNFCYCVSILHFFILLLAWEFKFHGLASFIQFFFNIFDCLFCLVFLWVAFRKIWKGYLETDSFSVTTLLGSY